MIEPQSTRYKSLRAMALLTCALAAGVWLAPAARGQGAAPAGPLPPIDPQKVQDQDTMTWADYKSIPGTNWVDPAKTPSIRGLRIALIAIDFDDQPFVITLPKKSDPFGNPQIDPIKREDVPQFYADFWHKPSQLNHGQTINGYWMEQSRGRYGISKIDAYGPYKMPHPLWYYGLNEYRQNSATPDGSQAAGRMENDCDALWRADKGQDIGNQYDRILRIYAGYDETGVWQEFGEMKFETRDDIPAEWGNPNPNLPRWVTTRYVDWTSWKAGAQQWGLSSIRQGENSGTIMHELGHSFFSVGDNNNNPYAEPYRRVGSGPWDMMDRGSFNGPGGPHSRWVVPVQQGGAMPAGLMLRQKINFGFFNPPGTATPPRGGRRAGPGLPSSLPSAVLFLSRDGLAKSGLAVANVTARAVDPLPGSLAGIEVRLDGEAVPLPAGVSTGGRRGGGGGGGGAAPGTTQDRTPYVDPTTEPLSPGIPTYNFYSLEVVQRIGYDSYCPDGGVLLAKNKDVEGSTGGPNGFVCFNWVIDAHPEDIKMVDFKRPKSGTPVMRTIADFRQLNDALFHAGTRSGSQYEYEDTPNRLHFYVIDVQHDSNNILSYTLGVRSLDGAGPQQRGVALAGPADMQVGAANSRCEFTLTNSGKGAETDKTLHPQDATAYLNSDLYRLTASVDAPGWSVQLLNGLAAVKFGDSAKVAVYVTHAAGAAGTATVTLKAVSEGDMSKSAVATLRAAAR